MKRAYLLLLCTMLSGRWSMSMAQVDLHILNHLAVGAEVGTMGWGVDVAMPVTPFVDVQAGFNMFPHVGFKTSIGMNQPLAGISEAKVKGKPLLKGGKLLVNVMPLPMLTSFHVTVGAYFGQQDIMGLYNVEPLPAEIAEYNTLHPDDPRGIALGNYLLTPDTEGNIDGRLKVNMAKPYVGIGIGRGVPKRRIGFKMDLGCVFWGKPTVFCNNEEVPKGSADGDNGGVMKVITKIKFYPVLNFRVCGKIF